MFSMGESETLGRNPTMRLNPWLEDSSNIFSYVLTSLLVGVFPPNFFNSLLSLSPERTHTHSCLVSC